jgi:hypothetical protein
MAMTAPVHAHRGAGLVAGHRLPAVHHEAEQGGPGGVLEAAEGGEPLGGVGLALHALTF